MDNLHSLFIYCDICKNQKPSEGEGFHPDICEACLKKKYHFQIMLYSYKKRIEKEGIKILTNTHGNFKFTMPYIIETLVKYKISNTKLGIFYRLLNLKENNNETY